MHVLARYKEGQWPYAEILLTTAGAFLEALNQANIIEQQLIEYGLDSTPLDEVENFLLAAEKGSSIERDGNEDNRPWSISVSIDETELSLVRNTYDIIKAIDEICNAEPLELKDMTADAREYYNLLADRVSDGEELEPIELKFLERELNL